VACHEKDVPVQSLIVSKVLSKSSYSLPFFFINMYEMQFKRQRLRFVISINANCKWIILILIAQQNKERIQKLTMLGGMIDIFPVPEKSDQAINQC